MVSHKSDNMPRDKGPCISDSEAANQSSVNVEHSSISCRCLQLRSARLCFIGKALAKTPRCNFNCVLSVSTSL